MNNYRPQLFIRTADITVALTFPEDVPDAADKMVRLPLSSSGTTTDSHQVMPGDNLELVCDLYTDVAAEVGTR